jgi:hydrogenase-4 component E
MILYSYRLRTQVRYYEYQGVILTVSTLVFAYINKSVHLLFVAALIFIIKTIFIPRTLNRTIEKLNIKYEKNPFIRNSASILISLIICIFVYFVMLTKVQGISMLLGLEIANGICVVFLGMFLMLSRKKAISQVIGLLLIENGMFAAALFGVGGMPLTVEIGTFFDLFFAVLIMKVFIERINITFGSIDSTKLTNLRG